MGRQENTYQDQCFKKWTCDEKQRSRLQGNTAKASKVWTMRRQHGNLKNNASSVSQRWVMTFRTCPSCLCLCLSCLCLYPFPCLCLSFLSLSFLCHRLCLCRRL